ncbi:hypothetical protein [Caenibacillus caldisaponilyticus]|uniref:hypothetical protein n=1 Tax=Caenibacillus caldisaponilyticus TaxID=1674942 RepID=UPI0009885877|nr:hypothetical protein [Caenibacillus caldisaponilyticus]
MERKAMIDRSGNAVAAVFVDTLPMAYAMLACLHATGRFSDREVNEMLTDLNTMTSSKGNVRFFKSKNRPERVHLYKNR